MFMKVVIVGGVAGGASAAARLRRLDENAEIIVFERGGHVSFANCGLPYYIGGVIEERDKLLLQTPQKFYNRFRVDVRVKSEVIKIDREQKEVLVKDLNTGKEYRENYDKLVLSPGAEPLKPTIPGIDGERIFTLRSLEDTDKIKEYIDTHKPQSAVVVGGGFIGLEMVENLRHLGLRVSLVELADQVMPPLDVEMTAYINEKLLMNNVALYLKDGVKSLSHSEKTTTVYLQSGKKLECDLVISAMGIRPEGKLAKEAGLEVSDRGAIVVNSSLQTSDPDIYAVGDAIQVEDFVTGEKTVIPLASPANKQGRMVADHICGNEIQYEGSLGTAVAKIFDMTVASTGANEKALKRKGVKYIASHTHSGSHAGYYPGAIDMAIKILFSPDDGKLLGAQAVGYKGVDKRIDVLATVIRMGGTVHDLIKLELAYAPPYSSAKDPVNMAGYVAENILKGRVKNIQWHELQDLLSEDTCILDVRDPDEVECGKIPGSINIPLNDLRERVNELPQDKKIVVYCKVGLRAYIACRILAQKGFENVYNLSGGYKTYQAARMINPQELQAGNPSCDEVAAASEKEIFEAKESRRVQLNACGLQCPGPIVQVKKQMQAMNPGDILEVVATDPAFGRDIQSWCNTTGNILLAVQSNEGKVTAKIQKGKDNNAPVCEVTAKGDEKTMVVFSGDLDKAIASFIIANGAAATGKKVTMFFTFWGLNILRKPDGPAVKKGFIEKMFGMMMPKGAPQLTLSKMNMGGLGSKMMKWVMNKKNVDSLEKLIQTAQEQGVKMIACQMSMDVMGIKKEELIDGVEIGGVATYLDSAERSNLNLFI
ncbi:MAG: pyridine nucleotide-disulfide oxidoreductase [Clostridiales bacterium]|jgi:CoA-disulfide reductase|nr:pyridine nucleotide-disulfide oxidoreductase [Clostridiales bacterium]